MFLPNESMNQALMHYNIISSVLDILRVTYTSDLNNYAWSTN